MSQPEKPACGAPTADGTPCQHAPFALGGGRCHRHAGLASTAAERESAARARLTHGMYATGLRTEDDREFYEQARGGVDAAEVLRDVRAYAMTRMRRVAAWDAARDEPSPLVSRALKDLRTALADVPPEAQAQHRCLDYGEIERHVGALLDREPEIFISRYPPPVQEAIRKALREGGESAGEA